MLYFAYDSTMSPRRMLAICPSAQLVRLGYLPWYKWRINRRGFPTAVPEVVEKGMLQPYHGALFRKDMEHEENGNEEVDVDDHLDDLDDSDDFDDSEDEDADDSEVEDADDEVEDEVEDEVDDEVEGEVHDANEDEVHDVEMKDAVENVQDITEWDGQYGNDIELPVKLHHYMADGGMWGVVWKIPRVRISTFNFLSPLALLLLFFFFLFQKASEYTRFNMCEMRKTLCRPSIPRGTTAVKEPTERFTDTGVVVAL